MTEGKASSAEAIVQITKVEYDRKEKHRYRIYVNNEHIEPLLSVHEDVMIKFRLLKGREIQREELRQIAEEDTVHRAYALSLAYLGARPRTNQEIARYLARKGIEEQAIKLAIRRLEQERLLDDTSYASRFAAERLRNQKKGRRLLEQELTMRGIAKETAREATAQLDEEEELEIAVQTACKKWPKVKGEQLERKRKLAAFLMRRGFPGNVVKRAIQAAIENEVNDEERHMLDN
ncbi:RecX family transcriptional regulator [Paenibacillus sp. GCM10027626]|uniref:RecX family transcriptional regulator n=1 Tax=Paenibacillus sp. GCM10027626 TaxID=3273411 RepID=UPI0036396B51